jgi:hypothetical protein
VKKNNWLVIFFSIVILSIVIYALTKVLHREELGQLEAVLYDPSRTYCSYIIENGQPEGGLLQPGDKICILCDDNYPAPKKSGFAQISFISESGLVLHHARIENETGRHCAACTDAKKYYQKRK